MNALRPPTESPWIIRSSSAAVSFEVLVVPRASRSRVVGLHGHALKVTLAAPPVDGAANEALCVTLAKALGVNKRAVQITRGAHSKLKTVQVEGVTEADVRRLEKS